MNIGVNIASMTPGASGGHECYVRNIIRSLADIDNTNKYVLVTGPMNYKTFERPGPNWKVYLHEGSENTPLAYFYSDPNSLPTFDNNYLENVRRLYGRVRGLVRSRTTSIWQGDLPRLVDEEQLDIWFCPLIYALPLDIDIPVVNTVPDLQHEHYPELFNEDELRYRAAGYQYSCKAATSTLAVSEATARDLAEIYDINASKTFVTHLSIDPSFCVGSDTLKQYTKKVKTKYGIHGDYIYYPANGWPHKNHAKLAEALHLCRKQGLDLALVLTGTPFGLMNRLKETLDRYGVQDCVRHLGYVNLEHLIGLYGGAKAMVFPSLFEGFGIPLLEAMALGTPIACSNVTSLPEVGGDVPIYFDPKDAGSIADSITRIARDENLRMQMIAAGKERVKRFSYQKTAKQTLDVFQKVIKEELRKPHLAQPEGISHRNTIVGCHGRWYFHCRALERVTIHLILETDRQKAGTRRITASLNDEITQNVDMDRTKECQIVLAPEENPPDGFYKLDIRDLSNGTHENKTGLIRVIRIQIADTSGYTLDFVWDTRA